MALHVVKEIPEADDGPLFPAFDGKPVSASKAKVARVAFELDETFTVDEIVEVTLELRVSGVSFNVNESSGDLERLQTMRVLDVVNVRRTASPQGGGW